MLTDKELIIEGSVSIPCQIQEVTHMQYVLIRKQKYDGGKAQYQPEIHLQLPPAVYKPIMNFRNSESTSSTKSLVTRCVYLTPSLEFREKKRRISLEMKHSDDR